ncbi:hypothetical protein HUW48_19900 [Adhaeribacter radiodurans]|uniref:Uncharacterized protein n=1 Tax=Adhaeribacter radiodurans TaxID=2745197 RepID=A0A7L7LBE0_9BACT|nr:hypothetical protein HUW48_19900 [Adhaeribacter radiodurans]
MQLYDFIKCNSDQRKAMVWEHGQFVADRISGDYTVCLYHMGKFFAEIWYHVADNEIQTVRGFKSLAQLEPYLNLVDISEFKN